MYSLIVDINKCSKVLFISEVNSLSHFSNSSPIITLSSNLTFSPFPAMLSLISLFSLIVNCVIPWYNLFKLFLITARSLPLAKNSNKSSSPMKYNLANLFLLSSK